MSITAAEAPCWYLIHTSGSMAGAVYEVDEVSDHYATHAAAEEIRAESADEFALEARRSGSPCFTATCDGCGYVLDEDGATVEHHPTREAAVAAALEGGWEQDSGDVICPQCKP